MMSYENYYNSDFTMELEGLFLLSSTCYKGDNTKLYVINLSTPMTNCHKEMLDDLERQIPKNTKCHGLIASRVAMKSGNGKMYFISPIKVERWKAYIDTATYFDYTEKLRGVSEKMVKEHATKFGNDIMRIYGWEEPKQHPPTRMCDVD